MAKAAATEIDEPIVELLDAIVQVNNDIASQAPGSLDPTQTGITALRAADETAMKLWSIKGPKGTNSTVSAVLLQGAEPPRIVHLHQFSGGKFAVFEKVGM